MSDDELKVSIPEKLADIVSKMTVNFYERNGTRIYVVKRDGRYLRIPQAGVSPLGVASARLATRFDSALWAASWASMVGKGEDGKPAKVVRLTTKAEREADKFRSVEAGMWVKEAPKPDVEVPPPASEKPAETK